MRPARLIERRFSRFLREPLSVRRAASTIVTATALVVVAGGVLMTVVDHHEFPNVWLAMWWSLQTVTTVGYGDVVPREAVGRVIGAFIMLEGTAFIAIITAAITSTFVARATRERGAVLHRDEESEEDRVAARFDELDRKLDRLEATLCGPQDT